MRWTLNKRETGRIEFLCEHGIGHYPVWSGNTIHGCDGCCRSSDFPGRVPIAGDLALCGAGTLGVLTSSEQQKITYPDGDEATAWVGIKIVGEDKGQRWSSVNPIIVGTIHEMYRLEMDSYSYMVMKLKHNLDGVVWKV